jgi:hypothetical protein
MDIKNLELFVSEEMKQNGEYKIIKLKETFLCAFKNGEVYRWYDNNQGRLIKNPKFKIIKNVANTYDGYNQVGINGKMTKRHRIICYTFKNLDINNEKLHIDHIDGNKINNNINNLRIVNNQQNCFNRTSAKGFYWNKQNNKWCAQIGLNGKLIHLGLYTNEQDARKAYLNGKLLHHVIELDHVQQELNEIEQLEEEFQRIVNI